jgi:NADH:ubiquinone oxidoreductase subunit 2 (subunit N)
MAFDLWSSILGASAEIVLCSTIVLLLLSRMIWPRWNKGPAVISFLGGLLALVLLAQHFPGDRHELFGGMLISDSYGAFFRILLILFFLLFVILTATSGLA